MSRRGGYQANAAVLGVLAAVGVVAAAVTIGAAETRGGDQMTGTVQLTGASAIGAGTLDASVTGPATAVNYQVSETAQRLALATSGGPWIIGYNAKNGTGTVFGVIGGYKRPDHDRAGHHVPDLAPVPGGLVGTAYRPPGLAG
jgi:hypothetical protein